jgi:hypothetical protein
LHGEEAAVPVGEFGAGKERGDLFGAVFGEEPLFQQCVDVVELRDFDKDRRNGGGAAGDEFNVADGGEEGSSTALSVLPAFALLEAKGGEEAGETVKFSAWRAGRGDGADKRNSLNHRFDCIVWESVTSLLEPLNNGR